MNRHLHRGACRDSASGPCPPSRSDDRVAASAPGRRNPVHAPDDLTLGDGGVSDADSLREFLSALISGYTDLPNINDHAAARVRYGSV